MNVVPSSLRPSAHAALRLPSEELVLGPPKLLLGKTTLLALMLGFALSVFGASEAAVTLLYGLVAFGQM